VSCCLIARAGIEIHGVDNFAPMLATLKENLAREQAAVRQKVTLQAGDMREFRLGPEISFSHDSLPANAAHAPAAHRVSRVKMVACLRAYSRR
jgi:hypothetical protein